MTSLDPYHQLAGEDDGRGPSPERGQKISEPKGDSLKPDGQTVYTSAERESRERGPKGRPELERGHVRSWCVVVEMRTRQAVDGCRGCAEGVAVPQPGHGCVVVNQSGSPTLPLASLSLGGKTV